MLLETKSVRVMYGKAEALKNISIGVDEGEVVTLIGSNGAGKTTVLRAICGLKGLSSGEIRLREKKINGMLPHDIVKMGIAHVPEGRRVFSTMTVRENLELGAYLRKDRRKIADDLENIYGSFPVLKERQKQKSGSLSGGEQQMLAMGRALMAGPSLLLLDEPSLGLSPLLVQEVARIIRSINQGGVSIILIEQNARMALKLAHRAYILEVGHIVLQGKAGGPGPRRKREESLSGEVSAECIDHLDYFSSLMFFLYKREPGMGITKRHGSLPVAGTI